MNAALPVPPFTGAYIHVPFCRKKCDYCAFYSVPFDDGAAGRWTKAVLREMMWCADPEAATLYVGGGTPTVLPAELLERLLRAAKEAFPQAVEFTVEANPDSFTPGKAAVLKQYGVTRVSLGIQSIERDVLERVGRRGPAPEVDLVLSTAEAAGFDPAELSFDVMFGVGGRPGRDIAGTVEAVISAGVGHVSLYALTVEDGTPLAERNPGAAADDEACAEEYMLIDGMLTAAGFHRYELSNYAKPGMECIHNLNYWKGGEWIGIGPGASGTRRRDGCTIRVQNLPDAAAYTEALVGGREPPRSAERLSEDEEMEEEVFLRLRLAEGLDIGAFEAGYGAGAASLLEAAAGRLAGSGLLNVADGKIIVPLEQVMLSDEITVELLEAVRP
ncbi:MAG: radical SAM family heme chaperone HemW [Planctomycetes bacterium]|nr:radical SAM family heme chaperone HemW [Planctomycetota bacterium]